MTEQEVKMLRAENAALRQEVKSLTDKITLLLKVMSQTLIKKDSP
jgi:cell division protein FtsB